MTVKAFCGQGVPTSACDQIKEFTVATLLSLQEPDHYVEVHVLSDRAATRAALQSELEERGPRHTILVPDFRTFHEAFAGYPRIWVSAELDLTESRSRAVLQHEVGHAVLHWEISSYLIGIAEPLKNMVDQGKMSSTQASTISYLVLIGVKDYEVSQLLRQHGIADDQIPFYCEELDDVKTRGGQILELLAEMKIVLGSAPFSFDRRLRAKLEGALERLGDFGETCRSIIYDLSHDAGSGLVEKLEKACVRVLSHHG